jgi:hypothetical protein
MKKDYIVFFCFFSLNCADAPGDMLYRDMTGAQVVAFYLNNVKKNTDVGSLDLATQESRRLQELKKEEEYSRNKYEEHKAQDRIEKWFKEVTSSLEENDSERTFSEEPQYEEDPEIFEFFHPSFHNVGVDNIEEFIKEVKKQDDLIKYWKKLLKQFIYTSRVMDQLAALQVAGKPISDHAEYGKHAEKYESEFLHRGILFTMIKLQLIVDLLDKERKLYLLEQEKIDQVKRYWNESLYSHLLDYARYKSENLHQKEKILTPEALETLQSDFEKK